MVTRYRIVISVITLLLAGGIGTFIFVSGPETPGDNEAVDLQSVGSVPENITTDFFLKLDKPEDLDSIVETPQISIEGRTRVDAVVTVNDFVLEPDLKGRFVQSVVLLPGLNIIEVIASVSSGEQEKLVLAVGYSTD